MDERDASRRARRQRDWTVRMHPLGADVPDDAGRALTAEERIALVWTLSARMWELTGRPLPTHSRVNIPIAIVRRQ